MQSNLYAKKNKEITLTRKNTIKYIYEDHIMETNKRSRQFL